MIMWNDDAERLERFCEAVVKGAVIYCHPDTLKELVQQLNALPVDHGARATLEGVRIKTADYMNRNTLYAVL